MLYYTRKSENPNTSFMDNMFACRRPLTSKEQNGAFQTIIEQSLGDDCSFETVKSIHENINEMIEEQKDLPEPVILDKNDVKGLLVKSGIKEENLNDFDEHYERIFHDEYTETASETNLTAANITNPRNLEVKTTDVVIKVKPERSDLIETRIIDGIPYILIQVNEHVELNGVIVKPDEG